MFYFYNEIIFDKALLFGGLHIYPNRERSLPFLINHTNWFVFQNLKQLRHPARFYQSETDTPAGKYRLNNVVSTGVCLLGCLFVCLFCFFTSKVNSYGHGGTVSSPNHTFSWASLNKQLTSTSCTYFRL